MNRSVCLFLLGIAAVLAGCRKDDSAAGIGDPGFAHLYQFQRQSPGCADDSMRCATIRAVFPVLDMGKSAIRQRVNDTILYHVKYQLGSATFSVPVHEFDLDQLGAEFLRDYQDYLEETDFAMPWAVECEGEILYHNERVLTVALDGYRFTGGAHPNVHLILLNFDLQTGLPLRLQDILLDSAAFYQLAEEKFRQTHQLRPGTDWSESGFFWDGNFHTPPNFAIIQEGIYFFYNTYEIAPYAQGPTEFYLTREALEGIVDPAYFASAQ